MIRCFHGRNGVDESCSLFDLPSISPYGNGLRIAFNRVQVTRKNMTYPNKSIVICCLCLFLFLCQIPHAEDRSETSPLNEDNESDSLRISDRWLAWDKLEHFGVSAFLSGLSYEVYHDFYNNGEKSSLCFSCGLTFSLGLGKEVYDEKRSDGRFSYKDLVADALGIATGVWIATR